MIRKQKAKTLNQNINRSGMRKDEIERRIEEIFEQGSRQDIEKATTTLEKIIERIEEMSKREEQFEMWER